MRLTTSFDGIRGAPGFRSVIQLISFTGQKTRPTHPPLHFMETQYIFAYAVKVAIGAE